MAWLNTKKAGVFGTVVLLVLAATTAIVFRHKIANQIARAGGRRAIANHLAAPLDLTGNYIGSASDFQGSRIWKAVPFGFQVFHHVPLHIGGMMILWGRATRVREPSFPNRFSESP